MVNDATPFGIVGGLSGCCYRACLVYSATQTTKCVKGGCVVGFGRRGWIFLWKFFAGTWNRFLFAVQLLEYYGIFYRILWRVGNGIWNPYLVMAYQRTGF